MRAFFFSAFVSCAVLADDDYYSRQLENRRVDAQLDQRRYEAQRFEINRVEQQRVRQQQDTEAQAERDARYRQQQQQRYGTSSLAPLYPARSAAPRRSMTCAPLKLAAPQVVQPEFTGYFQNSYVFAAMKLGEAGARSRLTVATHFRDGKALSEVGAGKTDLHYYLDDVDYTAVSGAVRVTRADQREQAGSYAVRISNLVLVDRSGRCFVAPDFNFSASWNRANEPACRRITLPKLTEMDADVGFYKPANAASYLRSSQGFATSSGRGGISFVLSKTDGWPGTVEGGGVHLKLVGFGREYRAVSGALGYPRMKLSVAEGDVVVRVRNARFEQVGGDDCLEVETFDLAVAWTGVDPLTRDASLH